MATEENTLPVELGRLEIEGRAASSPPTADENPFQRRSSYKFSTPPTALFGGKCSHCANKKVIKTRTTFKRSNGKLLKDPVLKYVSNCHNGADTISLTHPIATSVSMSPANRNNNSCKPREDVHTLVSGCSQMRISIDEGTMVNNNESDRGNSSSSGLVACSQQALNPPCDVTIDELACYFETLVHIPKKMSSMAEMMYI